ncbi:NADPH oxidase activator 1 [Planoprotostelium fungivorum]|uniref:NADPH oxidase activator 1 n=1 Tax=Planoprotostelium fungivorum TaxID=1890364 RepID=A0A2P6N8M5_9EUKA|nr:NADPH oxidase activator 1 [Planoprotostelium fungivorum]
MSRTRVYIRRLAGEEYRKIHAEAARTQAPLEDKIQEKTDERPKKQPSSRKATIPSDSTADRTRRKKATPSDRGEKPWVIVLTIVADGQTVISVKPAPKPSVTDSPKKPAGTPKKESDNESDNETRPSAPVKRSKPPAVAQNANHWGDLRKKVLSQDKTAASNLRASVTGLAASPTASPEKRPTAAIKRSEGSAVELTRKMGMSPQKPPPSRLIHSVAETKSTKKATESDTSGECFDMYQFISAASTPPKMQAAAKEVASKMQALKTMRSSITASRGGTPTSSPSKEKFMKSQKRLGLMEPAETDSPQLTTKKKTTEDTSVALSTPADSNSTVVEQFISNPEIKSESPVIKPTKFKMDSVLGGMLILNKNKVGKAESYSGVSAHLPLPEESKERSPTITSPEDLPLSARASLIQSWMEATEKFEEGDLLGAARQLMGLESSRMCYNLGITYLKMDKPKSAIVAFEDALKKDPQMAVAHYTKAQCYFKLKVYHRALSDYSRAKECLGIEESSDYKPLRYHFVLTSRDILYNCALCQAMMKNEPEASRLVEESRLSKTSDYAHDTESISLVEAIRRGQSLEDRNVRYAPLTFFMPPVKRSRAAWVKDSPQIPDEAMVVQIETKLNRSKKDIRDNGGAKINLLESIKKSQTSGKSSTSDESVTYLMSQIHQYAQEVNEEVLSPPNRRSKDFQTEQMTPIEDFDRREESIMTSRRMSVSARIHHQAVPITRAKPEHIRIKVCGKDIRMVLVSQSEATLFALRVAIQCKFFVDDFRLTYRDKISLKEIELSDEATFGRFLEGGHHNVKMFSET